WSAVTCFLIGGLAKSSIVPLPLLLFLYEWYRGYRPRVLNKFPFVLITIGLVWLSIASKVDIGVIKPPHGGSRLATTLLMGRVWLEYLAAFALPLNLSAAYYYPRSMAYSPWHAAALALVLAAHLGLWVYRRRYPGAAFALFWFTLAMLPVANVIPIAVVRADRYVY